VNDLVALYVRLALVHRDGVAALELAGRAVAADELLSDDTGDDDEALRRQALLRLRFAARARAQDDIRALEADLAATRDALRWMLEHCATAGADDARRALAAQLATSRTSIEAMRELCTLRDDSVLDGETLVLGKPKDEPTTPPPPRLRAATSLRARVGAVIEEEELVFDRTGDIMTERAVSMVFAKL